MISTELRAVTQAPQIGRPGRAAVEPSHIHIPRPSRLRQAAAEPRQDETPLEAPLEEFLEPAA